MDAHTPLETYLQQEVAQLKSENQRLQSEITCLQSENQTLQSKIAYLKRRVYYYAFSGAVLSLLMWGVILTCASR
jgi:FtsZ-binding cell division protein ZapB